MKTPTAVAALASELDCTACDQPTYTPEVQLRLYCFRARGGATRLVRMAGTWREQHFFEIPQLQRVARRLGTPLYFVVKTSAGPEFVNVDESIEPMRAHHQARAADLRAKLDAAQWLLTEIDAYAPEPDHAP